MSEMNVIRLKKEFLSKTMEEREVFDFKRGLQRLQHTMSLAVRHLILDSVNWPYQLLRTNNSR